MTLDELLALLPDNDTGAIDASDLRTIVTELYTRTNDYAQVFGYLWQASASAPPAGKAGVSPPWSMSSDTLTLNEVADDGQNLIFNLIELTENPRVQIVGAGGGVLKANITGVSVDHGSYRDIPIAVTGESGIAPINGEKVSILFLAAIP